MLDTSMAALRRTAGLISGQFSLAHARLSCIRRAALWTGSAVPALATWLDDILATAAHEEMASLAVVLNFRTRKEQIDVAER